MTLSQEIKDSPEPDSLPLVGLVPLICPRCLRLRSTEQRLEATGSCPSCGVHYRSRDDIPILVTEDKVRQALNAGVEPNDAGSQYYQEYDSYWQEFLTDSFLEKVRIRAVQKKEQLAHYLANTTAAGLVLEAGAGHGTHAGVGDGDYLALDYSLSFLQTYLARYRRVCASAETIPLASGSCRLVFSCAVFEHLSRPDLAFSEVDRVLAVGGVAYLDPAWHCRDWAAEGLSVRPYKDLSFEQKIRKALVPLRDSVIYRGSRQIPWRIWRRMLTRLSGAPSRLRFESLQPNYEHLWMPDSDACASIDSHEGILFFDSRSYEILEPSGGARARLLFGGGPIVVRKVASSYTRADNRTLN